jgi:NAD(P)-dependent dehydrogenase (short-subunit alcohol dehydrogenase family)
MTVDDWRWIRSVNLDGVVHGCAAFGPAMIARRGGQVVNVSSGLAYTMRATEGAYVATKAAVLALSRCLRADWAPHGVGVTVVCPGFVNTPIVGSTRYLGTRGDVRTRHRIEQIFRRGHPPETVARAIVTAAERNPAVVPVGLEARLGWHLHRITPLAVQDRLARLDLL